MLTILQIPALSRSHYDLPSEEMLEINLSGSTKGKNGLINSVCLWLIDAPPKLEILLISIS